MDSLIKKARQKDPDAFTRLIYVEGFQTKEISEILDMPESTVRSRLARGRERLAKEFGQERR